MNRRVRILHEKGQKFKEFATKLLYAMTPESYKNAKKNVEIFIENEEVHKLSGWLEWWHDPIHFVFRYKRYIYLSHLSLFIFSQNFIRTK